MSAYLRDPAPVYVGLSLAVEKAKIGFKTISFDIQYEKIDMVNAGKSYIGDVVDKDLICVPTPIDEHQ